MLFTYFLACHILRCWWWWVVRAVLDVVVGGEVVVVVLVVDGVALLFLFVVRCVLADCSKLY